MGKPPPTPTSTSDPGDSNTQATRETRSSLIDISRAPAESSNVVTNVTSGPSTASQVAASPNPVSVTARPPPSGTSVTVAAPMVPSNLEFSTCPARASRSRARASLLFPTSSTSTKESVSAAVPLNAPSTRPSSTRPSIFGSQPDGSSPMTPSVFGSKPEGSYLYGPSIFATGTPTTSERKRQVVTFGQPSPIVPNDSVTMLRPPLFGEPFGFACPSPRSNAQNNISTIPGTFSRWPSTSSSASSSSAAALTIDISSTPASTAPLQTSPIPVPAAPVLATPVLATPVPAAPVPATPVLARLVPAAPVPATPLPAAAQSAPSLGDLTSRAATLSTWPNSGITTTTTGSTAPQPPPTTDCTASMLVKQLQAQIQPLKHKTLLSGLLSHFALPDLESLCDDHKCHVCLEPFLTGSSPELPIRLPCGHVCGSVCIIRWLAPQQAIPREKNCPICRTPIFGIECASEWNALTVLEKQTLGMAGTLQAMVTREDGDPSRAQKRLGQALVQPKETELPSAWGKGRFLQVQLGRDELQWRTWTRFLEDIVKYVESADGWSLWHSRRQLVIPIINMITVSTFIDLKKKGSVCISRIVEEVPVMYLPLHSCLDQVHPDYYLAVPGEDHYRKAADFHARIEARGCCLWNYFSRPYVP